MNDQNEHDVCPKCNKRLVKYLEMLSGDPLPSDVCFGMHMTDWPVYAFNTTTGAMHAVSGEPAPMHATLIDSDLDKIRAIVRGELQRTVDEQEQKLDELFKPQKHDGELPFDQFSGTVSYHRWDNGLISVLLDIEAYDKVHFSVKKALSLRDWLNQESDTLEQLAKEQES